MHRVKGCSQLLLKFWEYTVILIIELFRSCRKDNLSSITICSLCWQCVLYKYLLSEFLHLVALMKRVRSLLTKERCCTLAGFWPHAYFQQLAAETRNDSELSAITNPNNRRPSQSEVVYDPPEPHIGIAMRDTSPILDASEAGRRQWLHSAYEVYTCKQTQASQIWTPAFCFSVIVLDSHGFFLCHFC